MTTQETLPFGYSDKELIEFKNNILSRLEKANTELEYLQSFIVSPDDENRMFLPDKKDDDTGFEKEQISQMIVRQQTFINNLNEALIRIEKKTYGLCRVTGKLIDKARLLAVPHATLSLEAKLANNIGNPSLPQPPSSESAKKSKPKKEKKQAASARYPDNDLREFKTIISNKMEAANEELKYFRKVLEWRNKNIKIEGYEDMKPAEVEALIERQQSFISELQNALDRVRNKTYGIDEDSGELTPKEALIRNVIIRRIKATPDHPSVVTEHTAEKIRTCRICGCTEDDCKQCIEKTGEACHWIDVDLCSACEEEAMKENLENQFSEKFENKQEENQQSEELINQSNNDNDMNFFQQLASLGHIDLTMRMMQDKNGKITIGIEPGLKSHLKPLNFTGTPAEFDEEFFKKIIPAVKEIKGIVSNAQAVKKDAEQEKDTSPAATPVTATMEKKKPAKKQKAAVKKKVAEDDKPEINPEVKDETVQQPVQENADAETEPEETNDSAE
jgi:PRTRC genetic system protein E